MANVLWRFTLTILFLISLVGILAIVWEVPTYLGYNLPPELSKLPTTLLVVIAFVTGIWWTWSRGKEKVREVIVEKVVEKTVPEETKQTSDILSPR